MSKARIVFLSLLFCLTIGGSSIKAQDSHIGVKGGISIPSLVSSGDNEVSKDYRARVAPNFGAFAEIPIHNRFSIQPEINYAGQGGVREGVQPITRAVPGLPSLPTGVYYFGEFKNVAVLNYLEIPVLAKLRLGITRRIYATGGLYYGRLLNAKTITSGSSTIYLSKNKTPLLLPPANQPLPAIPFDATTDIKNDVHHNNYGITGGGGIDLPGKGNRFFVDVRVSYGFVAVQKDGVKNGTSHTGNLVISLGYKFKLK
ncbi:MAG: PorT family protein [Acidobacteria bacterium]|nr:PorT family protein [Acidobacteriota bacterium]